MNRYLETFFRRKELFLIPFLATPLIALIVMAYIGRQYEVKALIWTEANSFLTPLDEPIAVINERALANAREAQAIREWLETEAFRTELMGRMGLTEAIRRGDWPQPSRLSAQLSSLGISDIPGLQGVLRSAGLAPPSTTDEAMQAGLGMIKKTLTVNTEGNNLVHIAYRGPEPLLGQRMVEQALSLYRDRTVGLRADGASVGVEFYTRQVRMQEERVQQAREALRAYLEAHPTPPTGFIRPAVEEAEIENLQRAYLMEHTLYEDTLRRLEQIRIESEAVISNRDLNFQVIDPPVAPEASGFTAGTIAMTLILGFAIGGVLGLLPIVIGTWTDGTVRSTADIERIVKAPIIAQAPLLPLSRRRSDTMRTILARRARPVIRSSLER